MNNSLRTLMTNIAEAHSRFARKWESVKAEELQKRGVDQGDALALPVAELSQINHVAYTATQNEAAERDRLLGELFGMLPDDPIRTDSEGINAILDFLEVDILAHRCGYTKAWYYHRLKRVPLDPSQVERLRCHCLSVCSSKGNRPEVSKLARLMVPHADSKLVSRLKSLAASESEFARRKARRVLAIILNSRADLRASK